MDFQSEWIGFDVALNYAADERERGLSFRQFDCGGESRQGITDTLSKAAKDPQLSSPTL